MTDFVLDSRLAADTLCVGDLPLCQVRLMDDAQYPWLILVPRRAGLREPFDLTDQEQLLLLGESRLTAKVLSELFTPDKLNIAAIGNVVSQLHIHHVVRFTTDAVWPAPVWGALPAKPRTAEQSEALLVRLRAAFGPALSQATVTD